MGKIMVQIEIPGISYPELREKLIDNPDPSCFDEDGSVLVDEEHVKRSSFQGYFKFEFIGVRP